MIGEYSEVKTELKFLFNSDIRLKILISLLEGPKGLSLLRETIKSSSSTILHAIYQLEEKGLVIRSKKTYKLSPTGKIISVKVMGILKTISVVERFRDFFLDHDIDSIPQNLLSNIESLHGAVLLESKPENLIEPYNKISEMVLNSSRVWILSAVYYPFYEDLFESKIKAELVIKNDVLDSFKTTYNEREGLSVTGLDRDFNISLIITDNFMAMGLFMSDGLYDPNRFLFSKDEESIEWARTLFRIIRDGGDSVALQ